MLTLTLAFCAAIAQDQGTMNSTAGALTTKSEADTSGLLWKKGGVFQLNFTQVSLNNWAGGGISSISGIAQVNAFANRNKGRKSWDNSLVMAYGLLQQDDGDAFKTDDRFELNSKYGYQIKEGGKWYAAGLFQFRTQFADGFAAPGDDQPISTLLAPAYILLGVGLDWKPNENLSVFISPAMSKTTLVLDDVLAAAGAFGVDAGELSIDTLGNITVDKTGSSSRFELGGMVKAQYTRELAKNITFLTRLDLFSNYLDRPQNIDVNWETMFNFKVNEWFAATLSTLLIYDHDIDIARDEDSDSFKNGILAGPATQFKETLGIGLTFAF